MIAALYARVSTAEQDPRNQLMRLREYAELHDMEVGAMYTDIASGANARRPALDDMLKDAKARKMDVILATKIDRIARSMINLLNVMESLEKWKVRIVFLDQPIDTGSASGKLTMNILGALAEFERELIHDRTMDGLKRAESEGRKGGRPSRTLTPYQLKKAREILEKNPQISHEDLAAQFNGISRATLIKLLRKEGMIA